MKQDIIIVRKAGIEDKKTLVDFQLAMANETENIVLNLPIVEKDVEAVLNDANKGIYYVAEYESIVVGSLLTTYEWSDWRNGTVLWIQSVFVKPDFRRKGIYSQMYSYLKKMVIQTESLKGIRLYADNTNHGAHKTYEKLGMNADHYTTFEWLK